MGVSSKHISHSNNFVNKTITNASYVFPLKICRTAVRQFLYTVCYAHPYNIIKTRNIQKDAPRFWYAGRDSNPRPTGS